MISSLASAAPKAGTGPLKKSGYFFWFISLNSTSRGQRAQPSGAFPGSARWLRLILSKTYGG